MKSTAMKTKVTALAACLVVAAVLGACAATKSLTKPHPEEVSWPPVCSRCHENAYASMDHDSAFGQTHRFYAAQREKVCAVCHQRSFCADCHASKEEIKPSDKYQDNPSMSMPHRGDYLTRHRIDGRVNPAPCFGCHGRKNDWRCRECHK